MGKSASLLAAIAVAVIAAGIAEARPEPDAEARSKRLLADSQRLARRDPEAALAKVREAYAVYPSPALFLPMAQLEERLGRPLDAIVHYDLVAGAGDEVAEAQRGAARERILQLELVVATLVLDARPLGAKVVVDETDLGAAPVGRPVRLAPGEHTLRVTHPGHQPLERKLTLKAGDRLEESVQLAAVRLTPPPEPPPRPDPAIAEEAEGRRARARQVFIAGLGFTGLLAGGAIVTGVLATTAHARFGDASAPPDQRADARDRGQVLAVTTDTVSYTHLTLPTKA